jgi:hypothetical protein
MTSLIDPKEVELPLLTKILMRWLHEHGYKVRPVDAENSKVSPDFAPFIVEKDDSSRHVNIGFYDARDNSVEIWAHIDSKWGQRKRCSYEISVNTPDSLEKMEGMIKDLLYGD